jgi:hypothetical protein
MILHSGCYSFGEVAMKFTVQLWHLFSVLVSISSQPVHLLSLSKGLFGSLNASVRNLIKTDVVGHKKSER